MPSSTGPARRLDAKNQRRGQGPGWGRTSDAGSLVGGPWSLKQPTGRLCWGHSCLRRALANAGLFLLRAPLRLLPGAPPKPVSAWRCRSEGKLRGRGQFFKLFFLFFVFYVCIFTWEHNLFVFKLFFWLHISCNILAFHRCFQRRSLPAPLWC